ncbi:MAG: hypothetical protein M1817_002645 [Caeruleum heppii]|nr:MAG: hypothetical protein M1817_002645 [Caeruleum heppii]
MHRKKVAVVGSGCSGIGAVWALKSTSHEVHLYEAESRLGGHTNTVPFEKGPYRTMVDSGFIVLNSATYPNFLAFLKQLGIKAISTDMTFGVSRDQGKFEWAGTSLSAVFTQRSNIFSLRMWRMIFDIIRFNQFALDLLSKEETVEGLSNGQDCGHHTQKKSRRQETIGEYIEREGYSNAFRDDYLIPMTAAVWSTSPDKVSLDFPAVTLIRFMWNHHLLTTISAKPEWKTIESRSQSYIDAALKNFPQDRIHLSTPIKSLTNDASGRAILTTSSGRTEAYDHVVLATHGNQALDIIRDNATDEEVDILSGFQTSQNTAVLHSDLSLMPRRRLAWSAWNYVTTSTATTSNISQVCLTYNMNILQHIPRSLFGDVLVTLNPLHPPSKALTQGSYVYAHPLYNNAAIRSQALLPRIQNRRGVSYAGAWTKYGFHEDGFSSGLKVAIESLGAELPFEFVDSTYSRGRRPVLGWRDWVVRVLVWGVQGMIVVLGWVLEFIGWGGVRGRRVGDEKEL